MTVIYEDGDACPVREEVFRVSTRLGLPVRVVSNGSRPARPPGLPLVEPDVVEPDVVEGPDVVAETEADEPPALTNAVDVVPLDGEGDEIRTDVEVVPAAEVADVAHPAGHDVAERHGGAPIGRARRRRAASRPAGPPS